jgi:glucose-6-phosphate isomerase
VERPDGLHRIKERENAKSELIYMATASGQRKRTPGSANIRSTAVPLLRNRPAWALLEQHYQKLKRVHLRQLFANDYGRGERLTCEAAGVYLDYSKNRITDETLQLLLQLARESGLRGRIDAMFRGDKINVSENRAVLHVALRAPRGATILHDGGNVVPDVHAVLELFHPCAQRRLERPDRQAHP